MFYLVLFPCQGISSLFYASASPISLHAIVLFILVLSHCPNFYPPLPCIMAPISLLSSFPVWRLRGRFACLTPTLADSQRERGSERARDRVRKREWARERESAKECETERERERARASKRERETPGCGPGDALIQY